MGRIRYSTLLVLALLPLSMTAQQVPSYSKQIQPFLNKYCVECHPADNPDGGLSLHNFKALMAGGEHGKALVPGKADESRIVRMVEGKTSPKMPPRKSPQPKADELPLLRAWVNGGAKDDSGKGQSALPGIAPRHKAAASVAALAYHPTGKTLAAARQHELLLLDESGEIKERLAQQQGKISALAWNKEGSLLAAAVGEPGASGTIQLLGNDLKQKAVLEGHGDVIHALSFSFDGEILASCGYDRAVKLWDVTTHKLLRDLRDHSDAVYGVAFSPDGKLLVTGGADRAVKVWDVSTGTRLYTLSESTDWVYAVAFSPDGRHVAAGGVDKSVRVWEVDREGGKVAFSVFAHEGPVNALTYAVDGKTLWSMGEDRRVKAWDTVKMSERQVLDVGSDTPLSLAVKPDGKVIAVGRFDGGLVLLDEKTGKSVAQPLPEKPKPPVKEVEPNDSPRTGQKITLPSTIEGTLDRAGQIDFFRFEARAGQEVGVQLTVVSGMLDAVLTLTGPTGEQLEETMNGVLGHTCTTGGEYAVGVRDRDYRGGSVYKLDLGKVAVVKTVFPLGVQRGTETEVEVEGVHLGGVKRVRVKVPADAAPGSRVPVTLPGSPLGNPSVVVGEFPDVVRRDDTPLSLTVPSTGNGRLTKTGSSDLWRFTAKKGERLLLDVEARRLGSPLDPTIEILDAKGKPLPRAILRSVARTYSTFRDHDSFGSGIRLETWSELAVNDYLLVNNEIIRIRALPKNPDDDCQFFSEGGRRLGYLGTTPGQLSLGTPMYKVTTHTPGTTFPPNGLPLVTLFWRNDDGGAAWGKDSFLAFDPPENGEYQVRVADARGQGAEDYVYRLTLRKPRPDFRVTFTPTEPSVWQNGGLPIAVNVTRLDGFDDEIAVQLEGLPPGVSAPLTTIPEGENSTAFSLFADGVAKSATTPFKLIAKASIEGKEVVHETKGVGVKVVPTGDIVTTTEQVEVTVKPGGQTRLTVRIERRNDFKGRIPLEVRGLPHGVRVLDIGLNGILVIPGETVRTIVIQCDPWVKPTEHPLVILAKREGKNTEHAARSVLLKVAR